GLLFSQVLVIKWLRAPAPKALFHWIVSCSGAGMRDDLRNISRQYWETSSERDKLIPAIEDLDIVLIDESRLQEAQHWVSGCKACSEHADIIFDYLLDAVTGCSPTTSRYILCRTARCPECSAEIRENTLVSII